MKIKLIIVFTIIIVLTACSNNWVRIEDGDLSTDNEEDINGNAEYLDNKSIEIKNNNEDDNSYVNGNIGNSNFIVEDSIDEKDEIYNFNYPITYNDAMNFEIEVKENPRKVILISSVIYNKIDTQNINSGIIIEFSKDIYEDSMFGMDGDIDVFEIIVSKPDLVICEYKTQNIIASELRDSKVKVIVVDPENEEDINIINFILK